MHAGFGLLRSVGVMALATWAGLSQPRPAAAATVFDASGPSLIVGANGLGIFAYRDLTNGDLMVGRCVDAACSAVTTSVIDGAADVGLLAMASASQGPVIAYEDRSSGVRLKLALCADPACAAANTVVVDPDIGTSGHGVSVAVGVDGRPIIAYASIPPATFIGALKVAHCDDASCSVATITAHGDHSWTKRNDIAIGPDGLAVVAWAAPVDLNQTIDVIHCSNAACTSATRPDRRPASADDASLGINGLDGYPSLAFGTNGLPVFASTYTTPGFGDSNASVTRCADASCDTRSRQYVGGRVGPLSLAIGADDLPRVALGQTTGGPFPTALPGLDLVSCQDSGCTQNQIQRLCLAGQGNAPSLVLDAGGPLVAYELADNVVVARPPAGPCEPILAVQSASRAEGNSGSPSLFFGVRLGPRQATAVTVDYTTADGTAQAGVDYVSTSGTITFPPQATEAGIAVALLPDAIPESDETFRVVLSNPSAGIVLADAEAVGTISDDDTPPPIDAADTSAAEALGVQMVFAVTLSEAAAQDGHRRLRDRERDGDVAATTTSPLRETITFPPGSTTAQVRVTIAVDGLDEPDETFVLEPVEPGRRGPR